MGQILSGGQFEGRFSFSWTSTRIVEASEEQTYTTKKEIRPGNRLTLYQATGSAGYLQVKTMELASKTERCDAIEEKGQYDTVRDYVEEECFDEEEPREEKEDLFDQDLQETEDALDLQDVQDEQDYIDSLEGLDSNDTAIGNQTLSPSSASHIEASSQKVYLSAIACFLSIFFA